MADLLRRCELCRRVVEPSYPCADCNHTTDFRQQEDAKLATSYTIDGLPVKDSYPLRHCASCGADASRVDAETLACIHCGGNPFVMPVNRKLQEHLAAAKGARTPDGGSKAYRALLDEAWELHIAKNTGYAGHSPDPWANFRQCEAFGISAPDGVLTRMSDKWSRLQSLWRNPERDLVGESLVDTLKDLGAYANILICLLQESDEL